MCRKQGFTLVELLAVIVILAIILAVAIPGISKILTDSKVSAYNSQMELIKRAASLYAAEYGDGTTVNLGQLIDKGLITSDIINPVTDKPFDIDLTINVSSKNNVTEYEIYEGPSLVTGMIPVYYDEASGVWKKADKTNVNSNWFDYNNQKWANAVTVTSTNRATYQSASAGTTIPMTDINTMFVWIPRFKYLIPAGTGAREIMIQFETKYTPKSTGNAVTSYYTHPAFTFGTEELSGIWVGKYETTGTITAPTIKPDLYSVKNATVKAMYDSIKTYMQGSTTYGFTDDNDTHMMKNTEWGAVAYLSQSRYGKYGNQSYDSSHKEIYLNNSSDYITGRSSGAAGGSGILTPTYEATGAGYYTYDGKCAFIHANLPSPCNSGSTGQSLINKNLAYGASTTGSIYGIYDMSGGSWEYVMGVYKPNPIPTGMTDGSGYSTSTTNSQFDLLTINKKYYDQYLAWSEEILGDATLEVEGWYGDTAYFLNYTHPWYCRSGNASAEAGVFHYNNFSTGASFDYISFRVTLIPVV